METDNEHKIKLSLQINLLLGFLGEGRSYIQDTIAMCIHDLFNICVLDSYLQRILVS